MREDTQNNGSQEIDLSYLFKKTSGLFDSLGYSLFRFFRFILRNIIILAILVVVGAVIGYFLDKQSGDSYKQEIIVVPNFNSTSYLYNKVENARFKDGPIASVEIKPIVNVYEFINEGYNNLEIAKYLSENNLQLTKYEEGSNVEKFYNYHLLTIYTTKEDEDGEIVKGFLKELNQDEYFLEVQKIEQVNLQRELAETDTSIKDVNNILQKLGSPGEKTGDFNIEMYSEINNLFNGKRALLRDYNKLRVKQLEQAKIIYDASIFPNIKVWKFPMLILIPVALVILFLIGAFVKNVFIKYKLRERQSFNL